MVDLKLVLPAVSTDAVSSGLRILTKRLEEVNDDPQGYGLGGQHGYGYDFENDVFLMFPFYWGDCTCGHDNACWAWESENKHRIDCWHEVYYDEANQEAEPGWDAPEGARLEYWQGLGWWGDSTYGIAVACTCGRHEEWQAWIAEFGHADDCPSIRPNFLHKPSGFKVDWYKYIGRGMEHDEIEVDDWVSILEECLASLE